MTHSLDFPNPMALPLLGIEAILANPLSSALIVAPHPDDETLGCGGAIALLRQLAQPVEVLVISDGTKSHPNSRQYPAPKLKKLRELETLAALAILGVKAEAVAFLGLPDGAVPMAEESGFDQALFRCQTYLQKIAPSIIFLPWRSDPHRDHRASWELVYKACRGLSVFPRLIEYPIWDWDLEQRGVVKLNHRDTENTEVWRLDVSSVLALKEKAIACYRSQITDLIDDDPEGFRLTPEMLANFTRPWEVYREAH